MREIKFRLWEKPSSRMIVQSESDSMHRFSLDPFGGVWRNDGSGKYLGDEYDLMQYTGLKDKNGQEIYEGDVVGFKLLQTDDMSVMRQVSFRKGSFVVNPGLLGLVNERCEVIGNIHQNPELAAPTDKGRD